MIYHAASDRYEAMTYRSAGKSGLKLPSLSLGLWHNFGDTTDYERQRSVLRTAFDLGITHFDLANNYGPPPGSAEQQFGRMMREDFAPYRDELFISTKAGWSMWPGPYGSGGGSRKHILASLDQSLQRMGLAYVDMLYSHRFDANTPLEETADALASAVKQGKALYVGVSSYSAGKTREMAALLASHGVPLRLQQPSYNMLNRWIEPELLPCLHELGVGCIAFTPLAQGLLTNKYLSGIPTDARINRPGGGSLPLEHLSENNLARVRGLGDIARERGQTLAQMALAWVLRHPAMTSALIGASRPEQIRENVAALSSTSFSDEEIEAIDALAVDANINLWEKPSTDQAV